MQWNILEPIPTNVDLSAPGSSASVLAHNYEITIRREGAGFRGTACGDNGPLNEYSGRSVKEIVDQYLKDYGHAA